MLKKLGIIGKPVEAIDYVAFKLDANTKGYVVPVEPYVREF